MHRFVLKKSNLSKNHYWDPSAFSESKNCKLLIVVYTALRLGKVVSARKIPREVSSGDNGGKE